jgi:hypothetical protein
VTLVLSLILLTPQHMAKQVIGAIDLWFEIRVKGVEVRHSCPPSWCCGSYAREEVLGVGEGIDCKRRNPATRCSQECPPSFLAYPWQLMTARTRRVSQTIIEVEAK